MLKEWTDPDKLNNPTDWTGDKIINLLASFVKLTSSVKWEDEGILHDFKEEIWKIVFRYKLKYDKEKNTLKIINSGKTTEFKLTINDIKKNLDKLIDLNKVENVISWLI